MKNFEHMKWITIALTALALAGSIGITAAATTTNTSTRANCQPGTGVFTGCFYSGTAFNTFLLQRQDPQINFTWGLAAPYSGGPVFQFSARWQGSFIFNAGSYRFTLTASQGARLYIDGQLAFDGWSGKSSSPTDVIRTMTAGTHLINLEYFNGWSYAYAQLSWQQDPGFRTFYVSPSGSDQNDGRTPSSAWQTASKVGSATFQPGDHVLFEGGQNFAGPVYFGADDQGTAALPIVVTSYGAGRATVQAGTSVGLLAFNTAGIEIRNLNFVGSAGNSKDGVQFYQTLAGNVKLSHIRIDNVETRAFGSAGISIFGAAGLSGYDDVQITNVSTHDNLRAGIWMGSLSANSAGYAHSNVYIANCQAYNVSGVNDILNDTGFGIYLNSTDGAIIERNVVYNNGLNTISAAGPMGIILMTANNIVVQSNEVHHMHAWTIDGGGIDFDNGVTNSVAQYNYVHDNDGAGFTLTSSSNTIRYNISQNDGRKSLSWAGILVAGAPQGSHIYNNTVYGTANAARTYTALGIIGATKNFDIRNNLLFATDGMQQISVGSGQVGLSLQGNAYWGGGSPLSLGWGFTKSTTLVAFRSASGQETVSGVPAGLELNPMLTAPGSGTTFNQPSLLPNLTAYTPLAGSPLTDRALNLSALGINPGTQDFIGTSVPQRLALDIGAVEAVLR